MNLSGAPSPEQTPALITAAICRTPKAKRRSVTAGFTALLSTMAGAADQRTELMIHDRNRHRNRHSVALVSEGARTQYEEEMSFERAETDTYGHHKLGGIGDKVSATLKELSAKHNRGRKIYVVNQSRLHSSCRRL